MSTADFLAHPLLAASGVTHGFGLRGALEPPGCVRPRQVHGVRVVRARPDLGAAREEGDAIVSDVPGLAVAVVTADCVPVLVSARDGACVAAIHAGWRGLAAGVVRAGIDALAPLGGAPAELRAVVGPHIGACCYEVDEPVIAALRARFGAAAHAALRPVRAGHALLDLGALVREDCRRAGLAADAIAATSGCTRCEATRFHSYRRDGPRAGRLVHHVAAGRRGAVPPA